MVWRMVVVLSYHRRGTRTRPDMRTHKVVWHDRSFDLVPSRPLPFDLRATPGVFPPWPCCWYLISLDQWLFPCFTRCMSRGVPSIQREESVAFLSLALSLALESSMVARG
jgi:hypothetical protein